MSENSDLSAEPQPVPGMKQFSLKLFVIVAVIVVVLDQLSKLWIRRSFPVGATQTLIENWLRLTHSQNAGAAWGMMSGQRWLLVLVSVGVSIFIIMLAREFAREPAGRALSLCALGLIFGGAVGNLIDRIAFGVVTDFFDLDTPVQYLRTFPIFNIADSALTVGVILLMLHFLLNRETQSPAVTVKTNPNASDSL